MGKEANALAKRAQSTQKLFKDKDRVMIVRAVTTAAATKRGMKNALSHLHIPWRLFFRLRA